MYTTFLLSFIISVSVAFETNNAIDIEYAIDYLSRYGYVPDNKIESLRLTTITDNATVDDISSYLLLFQANYNFCLLYTSRCV